MSIKLEQQSDSFTYYQGWYGKCPETGDNICESFSLLNGEIGSPATLEKKYPQILKILETRADSKAQNSYIGTLADGPFLTTQGIKELLCGHSYLIVLKKGNGFVEIPEFTFANAGTNDDLEKNRLALNCEVDKGCPTCENYLEINTTYTIDLENIPSLAYENVSTKLYDTSKTGTICFGEVDAGLPTTHYLFLEDEVDPFASVTVTGLFRSANQKLMYTTPDGLCYGAELSEESYDKGQINVYRMRSLGDSVVVVEKTPTPEEVDEKTPTPEEIDEKTPTPEEVDEKTPTPEEINEETPTPSPTVTPSPTFTPSPTETPTPSPTFTPSPTETPSPTPEEVIEDCCDGGQITGNVSSSVNEISMEITAQPFDCNGIICIDINNNLDSSLPTSVRINVNEEYMGALGVQGTLKNSTTIKLTITSTSNSTFTELIGKCLSGTISDNICNLTE
jgi:hypothetical protein